MSLLRSPAGFFGRAWLPAIAAALLFTALPAAAVDVGNLAPSFNLQDLHGQSWSISDQGGKVVLLFFFGHNADVCAESARQIQTNLENQYGSRGLLILGIDCWNGTSEQVQSFADQTGATFPLLLGGQDCAADYGLSYHSFVLIDARGVVRVVDPGPDASAFNLSALNSSILSLLEEANAISDQTWGRIKSLYGRKIRLG